ncbi:hypothetical protein EGP98_04915 [bacterium]|nr:hypothetical protein [bacterium]
MPQLAYSLHLGSDKNKKNISRKNGVYISILTPSIGMNNSIGDEVAIVFASQLYSSISFGLSLEKAF